MFQRIWKGLGQPRRWAEIHRARKSTRDWLRLTIAYVGCPSRLPFRIQLPSGTFEFRERLDPSTFWQVFFREAYPVQAEDRVVVDAGANIGAFTLFALLRAPNCHVIAIEPAPDSCERIYAMLREHGLAHRCTLHQAALGDRSGQTRMSLLPPSHCRTTGTGEISVPAVTLDELLAPYEQIDLLKMDTEGAEYPVFASASSQTLKRIKRIEMEYHPQGNPDAIFERLQGVGFALLAQQANGGGYGMARLAQPAHARKPITTSGLGA
jgi:FkbM family methyltransferase